MPNKTIPASLLKRVAEAADGYRNGEEIWCVAALKFPHDLEVFQDSLSAENFKNSNKSTHEIFGPFTSGKPPSKQKNLRNDIKDITITLIKNGRPKKISIDSNKIDCLFWSEAAFDKFVFPYYAQLYGVEHAAKIRKETLANTDTIIFGHTDGTRWLPKS